MELQKIRKIIAEILCVDPKEITENTTFVDVLCDDSLDVFQIIMGIEETFDIEIAPEAVENIKTVGEAIELIRSCGKEN